MPEATIPAHKKAELLEQGHKIISSILSFRWACEQAGIMLNQHDVHEATDAVKFMIHHIENQ